MRKVSERHGWRTLLLLAAASVASALPAAGRAADSATLSADDRAKIDAIFTDFDTPASPGCAMGVMRDGHLVYARGYGMADIERQIPITPASVFDIASTSKQFTAAAIVLLALDGKLALSDDVRKYLPELPDYGATITIDHLLRHTSGIRDYVELLSLAGVSLEQVSTDAQALAVIARQQRLNFAPGTRYDYSNSGYFLLSLIVQRVSGQPLAQFAQERLFEPLGMSRTRIRNAYAMLIPGRALGYTPQEDGSFRLAVVNWEQTGDGAVQISIEDVMKWAENFATPRLGGARFVELMEETGRLADGEPIEYARGLMVDTYRGARRVQHGGSWIGYRSNLLRFPALRTSIAVFCNRDASQPSRMTREIADIVLADRLAPVTVAKQGRRSVKGRADVARDRLRGVYFAADEDSVLKVVEADGNLALQAYGAVLPITATGPATYALEGYPGTIEFTLRGKAAAERMTLQIEGMPATVAARITPPALQASDLAGYAGTFYSPELDVTWRIVLHEGALAIRQEIVKFTPAMQSLEATLPDAFSSSLGFLRYIRDGSGRISGFELSASRMHGIRFQAQSGAMQAGK